MPIYTRYIAKYLIQASLLIMLIISSIVLLVQSLKFVDLMIYVGMDFADFLELVSLLLPSIFFLILPLVLFISSIYTYNKLYARSEILVLSACGLSKYQLLRPALVVTVFFILINYLFAFYLMPLANKEFKEKIQYYKEHRVAILIEEGIFLQPAKNVTLFVQQKINERLLQGIFIHDTRNPAKTTTLFAKNGWFVQNKDATLLYLENGNRQEIDKDDRYNIIYFDKLELDLELNTKTDNNRYSTISELYLYDLLFPPKETDQTRIKKMLVEASNRLIWPIISLIFVIASVNSVIGGEFSRFGKKTRILRVGLFAILTIAIVLATNSVAANHIYALLGQYLFIVTSLLYWAKRIKN